MTNVAGSYRSSPTAVPRAVGLAASIGGNLLKNPVLVMETDVAAVTAGGATPGWVSGSPANLALSASVNCVFDLGPEWAQYGEVAINVLSTGPSTGMQILLRGSDTVAPTTARAMRDVTTTTLRPLSDPLTTAAAVGSYVVKPCGRYVIAQITNNDAANAQGATSKVTLTAFPT